MRVKKLLTLTGNVKTIFKLEGVNLSPNNFWSFFRICDEVLPKNGNLTKTVLLGTFGITTLGIYNLLRNDLIHESMKFKGQLVFIRIVFKWSISK